MMRTLPLLLCAALPLAAQSPLLSTFNGGLQISSTAPPPAATALFDVTVTDPNGVILTQIDVNINALAGTTGTLGVWITAAGGTHFGNQLNPAAWTQVSTATRSFTGGRTPFTLQQPVFLQPGTYGMALHHVSMNPVYTNPATQVPPLPNVYANAELSMDMTTARVRASTVADPFGGTAAGASPRHPNVGLYYVPGPVYVEFFGTPTSGISPLVVQFSSAAVSGNPGGITTYAWDFDGDGIADSNLPNPVWVFGCGSFDVTLTIVDGLGGYSLTKNNYVVTDTLTPGFTNQLIGQNTVQFTDTTTPNAQTWAWDLDGDGLIDATTPNPVFVYPNNCDEVTVSLTVSRACQPPLTLTKRIAVATTLETLFQGGLITVTGAPGATNFFDANVTNPQGVTICSMHVNSSVGLGQPVTVNVFQKTGTYVGATQDATQWRLVGSSTVLSNGINQRTYVPFAPAIHLAAGVNGLGIEHVGASPSYTNLGSAQTYTSADLSLTIGLVQSWPTFDPTSTQFTPRIWNGALHFGTSQSNGAPGYGYIGAGCPGTLGVPGNRATTLPSVGGAANIVVDKLPFDVGVLAVGVSRTVSALGPLPVDLTFLGMPGCPLRVSFEATLTMIGAGNSASLAFPVPNTPSLVGVQLFTQALSFDPAINAFGFSLSDAAVLLVGQ